MYDNQERELKILLTEEQYNQIKHSYDWNETRTQINTYYDTRDAALRSQMAGLRIRQTQGKNILTLKLPADEITKYEYEREIGTSDIHKLSTEERKMIDDHIHIHEELIPTMKTVTERSIKEFPHAELCLDKTEFDGVTDYELEYEYLDSHDGIKVFNEILQPLGLTFEKNCPSKLARAYHYSSNL